MPLCIDSQLCGGESISGNDFFSDLEIEDPAVPFHMVLEDNYPNPFNPETTISYDLPEQTFVDITIYDIMGKKVCTIVNVLQSAGHKSIIWNAKDDYGIGVSAGLYIFQVQAGDFIQTKKMILVK